MHDRARMHAIFFGTKRAFHGILRVTRKRFASFGLTAARFDLLWALIGHGNRCWPVTQSKLRRELGISASTVCRMLQSLEALDLVRREVDPADLRQRLVELTNKGFTCMRAARKVLLRVAKRLVNRAFTFGEDFEGCLAHTDTLESYLTAMRRRYGDTARLYYPWHPDD
jgi:DNA-binding MarR family transcriptional regulator